MHNGLGFAAFIFAMVMLLGGLLTMSYAISAPGLWAPALFTLGGTMEVVAVGTPATLAQWEDRRATQRDGD